MKIEDFRQELFRASVCTQELFRKLVIPVCQRYDFTLQQMFVLGSLYQQNEQTPRELSDQIGVSPNNFALVVKKLEERSLVGRKRSAADGRVSILYLTEAGEELLQALERDMTCQYGSLFEQIPDETFRKIVEGFEALNELSWRI